MKYLTTLALAGGLLAVPIAASAQQAPAPAVTGGQSLQAVPGEQFAVVNSNGAVVGTLVARPDNTFAVRPPQLVAAALYRSQPQVDPVASQANQLFTALQMQTDEGETP